MPPSPDPCPHRPAAQPHAGPCPPANPVPSPLHSHSPRPTLRQRPRLSPTLALALLALTLPAPAPADPTLKPHLPIPATTAKATSATPDPAKPKAVASAPAIPVPASKAATTASTARIETAPTATAIPAAPTASASTLDDRLSASGYSAADSAAPNLAANVLTTPAPGFTRVTLVNNTSDPLSLRLEGVSRPQDNFFQATLPPGSTRRLDVPDQALRGWLRRTTPAEGLVERRWHQLTGGAQTLTLNLDTLWRDGR